MRNVSNSNAGALYAYGNDFFNIYVTVDIINSTFHDNTSLDGGGGGAILAGSSTTRVNITNSTIVGNRVTFINQTGGGLFSAVPGIISVRNSIVAGNSHGNCHGTLAAESTNNFSTSDGNTCGPGFTQVSNISALNLGALGNNGGPTQTMALNFPSGAIDTGNDAICANPIGAPLFGAGGLDQRGVARPFGAHCDVGAYEANPSQSGSHLVVNVLADTNDGSCDLLGQGTGNKDCTLREAITATNSVAGADLITFSVSGTITVGSTLPSITDNLTIDAAGAITVSGNDLVRVLRIESTGNLTLLNITVTRGRTVSGGAGGGGATNLGTLKVINSIFSNNNATEPFSAGGGAISNTGTLEVTNSTFTGNVAFQGGCFTVVAGTAHATNSTFFNNTATFGGACVANLGTSVTTLVNNTFAGNGGSSTVLRSGGTLTLRNTIVANSVSVANCSGTITNGGGNLQFGGATANSCGAGIATGDPVLGALGSNGGPTQTMSLGANSAAINAGTAATCAANIGSPTLGAGGRDQRGNNRRTGFCDSGAFEAQAAANAAVAGGSGQSTVVNTPFPNPLQVSVTDANNNLLGGAIVTYAAPIIGASATFNGNPTFTNGSGVASMIATANGIIGGPYDVSANAPSVAPVTFSLTNLPSPPIVRGTKTVGGTFKPGTLVIYTVTLTNIGSATQPDNATDEFVDVLPAGLTLINAAASSGTAANTGANTVSWNGSIAGSASVTISITAQIDGNTGGMTISNQGTIKYDADSSGDNDATAMTDDPAVAGSSDPTAFTVQLLAVTVAKLSSGIAAKVAEPTLGTTKMLFTVTLSAGAGQGGASVQFTTADEPAGPGKAVAGQDYTPLSVTLNFAQGQRMKMVAVDVLSDGDNSEPDETFRLNLSNAVNATIVDGTGTGTITATNPAGALLISELRTSGPAGSADEFVEIYNNSDVPVTVSSTDGSPGYGLFMKLFGLRRGTTFDWHHPERHSDSRPRSLSFRRCGLFVDRLWRYGRGRGRRHHGF